MKILLAAFYILFFVFVSRSQNAASPYEINITVLHPKEACVDEALSGLSCWKAKKVTDPVWTFEIQAIDDFQPTASGEYDLKVKLVPSGSSVTYELIEITALREE